MTKQADIFYQSEGSCWLERNRDKLDGENDPVINALTKLRIQPKMALEIGCANGWRLRQLEKLFHCSTAGLEPSPPASNNIKRGFAHAIPFHTIKFDLVIFGWCLYLCDREDLFTIAAEGDRVLAEDGYLVVHD